MSVETGASRGSAFADICNRRRSPFFLIAFNFLLILATGFASYRRDLKRGLIEAQARAECCSGRRGHLRVSQQFQQ